MEDDLCHFLLAASMYFLERRRINKLKKRKSVWCREWLKRREERSQFRNLLQELALEDTESFRNFLGLNRSQFEEILTLICPLISKSDTRLRKAVTAHERFAITLRYLATGESQTSISHQFRVSQNLISRIIPEVCEALYKTLKPLYLCVPATEEEWKTVASKFFSQWQFPLCLGAIDGKRVLIQKPVNSGSYFFDYNDHNSIILMALVDADYKFLYVDVGTNGWASAGGVWDKCSLNKAMQENRLNIPPPTILPMSDKISPYVIVGDEAFPLKTNIMKPYPGHDLPMEKVIHNYRLSRAKRVSENAFGILASHFQIYRKPIRTSTATVNKIVCATLVLHNYLCTQSKHTYSPPELTDREDIVNCKMVRGKWHNTNCSGLGGLRAVPEKPNLEAFKVRDTLCDYFNNEGKVPWKNDMALYH